MFPKGGGQWGEKGGEIELKMSRRGRILRALRGLIVLFIFYPVQRGSQCMSFLKRILTCGWNDHDDTPIVGLPRFCLNKKSRFGGAGKPKVKSIQSTMQSIQAESLCNPCPETTNTKYHLPSLSFLTCGHRQVNKVEELQLGSLVGIINNSREDESFLASDCFRVRIGKKHEISSLRSLRPKCLDSVLVFWNEIGCQFSLGQLLALDQRLVIAIQSWQTLIALLKNCQEELQRLQGQNILKTSLNRLYCNVTKNQSFFLVQFESEREVQRQTKHLIEELIKVNITEEEYEGLLEKMTLEDFINVRKNGEKECKRINIYLKQVLLEKIAKLESKDEAKEVPRAEVSEDTVSNRRAVSHRQASSSEVSEEVKYFANLESKQSCSPEFVERVEADLDIFNYNFEDEPEMLWDKTPSSRQNLACLSKGSRPIRTRSEDIMASPCAHENDDEFYDKYK